MGGDWTRITGRRNLCMLKSTPPAWAGTRSGSGKTYSLKLKSTPPAWAGTVWEISRVWNIQLKSTPPAWAGTSDACADWEGTKA